MDIHGYPVTLPRHIHGLKSYPLRPSMQAAGEASSSPNPWWAVGLVLAGLGLWELTSHKMSSMRSSLRR